MKTETDSHRLTLHPKRVSQWLEEGDCYPIYIEIGTTNRCNHRCAFCALDFLERGGFDIKKEIMLQAIKEMAEHGVKSIMFAGEGESLLHPNIIEFVETAKQSGIDVSITTNGVFFDREKVDRILPNFSWVRFSLDAGTKENYAKIHGCREEDFDKVIENLREMVKLKKEKNLKVTIGVQFLLINTNLDEALKAAKLIKEIGADNIQIKPYSHHPSSKNDFSVDYSKLDWLEQDLRALEDENFQVSFRKKTMQRVMDEREYQQCHGLPFFALIDAKGNVIPCNLFYNNPEFSYGNLNEKSFSEIWQGDKRKEVMKKINEKGILDCRKGCRLDPINKYLHQLKNPHPHVNFI